MLFSRISILRLLAVFVVHSVTTGTASAWTLIDALEASGATQFAQQLQADPVALALYQSSAVQTVFAPIDGSVGNISIPGLRKRVTNPSQQQQLQVSQDQTSLANLPPPGVAPPTNLQSSQLSQPQAVVVTPKKSKKSKLRLRAANATSTLASTSTSSLPTSSAGGVVPSTPLQISSGLGNTVNVLTADIPYIGGFIQLVDG
jgi:hypothetical protein